jgi:hypothetical protein
MAKSDHTITPTNVAPRPAQDKGDAVGTEPVSERTQAEMDAGKKALVSHAELAKRREKLEAEEAAKNKEPEPPAN